MKQLRHYLLACGSCGAADGVACAPTCRAVSRALGTSTTTPVPRACLARMEAASAAWRAGASPDTLAVTCPVHVEVGTVGAPCWTPESYAAEQTACARCVTVSDGTRYPGTVGAEWARFAELLRSV